MTAANETTNETKTRITGASSNLGLALAEAALVAGEQVIGWASVSKSADLPGMQPAVRAFSSPYATSHGH